MIFTNDPLYLLDAVGGLVIAGLGAWVLTIRPRTSAMTTLAIFCLTFGGAFAVQNAIDPQAQGSIVAAMLYAVEVPLLLAASISMLALVYAFPRPPVGRQLAGFWAVAAGALLLAIAVDLTGPPIQVLGLSDSATGAGRHVVGFAVVSLAPVMAGGVLFLAWRWRTAANTQERQQVALVMAALVLWLGYVAGALAIIDPTQWIWTATLALLAASGVAALAQTRFEPGARSARNVALLCFALPLVGMLAVSLWGGSGGFGVARLLMAFVLTYAILKHQLLGIDVKVRFAISKSTIAAVFIAVFFIASEAAQQFFGDSLGSTYVGIGVAGTLVFAMAPLQRAAERLAAKAVPLAAPTPAPAMGGHSSRAEGAYLVTLRRYLRDSKMSRDEERALAHLAAELRIDAGRAFELREQVEQEALHGS